MTAVMTRSFAEARGLKWPKNIASAVMDHHRMATWISFDQILQERKDKQAKHLRNILRVKPNRQPAFLWTFNQPGLFGFVYAGWWAYIRTLNKDWKLDKPREWEARANFTLAMMRQFPCGLLPIPENFERWKELFGKTYSRPGRFKKQGLVLGWVECGSNGWPEKFTPAGEP